MKARLKSRNELRKLARISGTDLLLVRQMMCILAVVATVVCFLASAGISAAQPPELHVVADEVKDIRPNGKEPGKLEVQLRIASGEMPPGTKGCRIVLTKAVDDVGVDLLTPENSATEFRPPLIKTTLKLNLKNPDRKAGFIRELSGNVEVFVPNGDATATVIVSSFRKQVASPIKSNVLKSAGMELTPRTGDQYNLLIKKREADDLKDSEAKEQEAIKAMEVRAAQQPNSVEQQREITRIKGSFVAQRQMQAFAREGNTMMAVRPSDIAISIKDPAKKLVGFEFRDASDKMIQSAGSTESYQQRGSDIEQTRTFRFQSPLPASAKLLIFVATPQALVKEPFTLSDIALP